MPGPTIEERMRREEEIAVYLVHHLTDDDIRRTKGLRISDKLCMTLGRLILMHSDGTKEQRDWCFPHMIWVKAAIRDQNWFEENPIQVG